MQRDSSQSFPYDAVLVVSFGGPEREQDVLPFLENVLRGRNVPRERMLEVAEHYYRFGGKSPINDQNRLLIDRLRTELDAQGPMLPVYWGNRNWHPFLEHTMRQMAQDGISRAIAFVTSAYSSYSGCRQYREDIERARMAIGPAAPAIEKLRAFYNHPGFLGPMIENTATALASLPGAGVHTPVLFTGHSIPMAMAERSAYSRQIEEASRVVAEALKLGSWAVAWQSRSGPPSQPWLEPDICDLLRQTESKSVAIVPIGFISDHMEVLYDLDEEARQICENRGIRMARAATVGAHPQFVRMIRELIIERSEQPTMRPALGRFPANHDVCPADCCPAPVRPIIQCTAPA